MTDTTPGALRAARTFIHGRAIPGLEDGPAIHDLAQIIDAETGLPELLEACEQFEACRTNAELHAALAVTQAAIAKARGE